METLRTVVTWVVTSIFGILAACFVLALTENFKELLKQWGATTFLVRLWDALPKNWRDTWRWERLRERWWFWSIFGLSGGIALTLWLTPFSDQPPTNINDHQNTFLSVGPPFAGKAVVGGPYLQAEINKMIQAVGSLSDIMHLDIKPTFDAAKSSIENWEQQVQSEGVPAFSAKLSLAASKLTSASKRIDEILSTNARYDNEIKLTVHDRDPGPFVRELGFFSSDIPKTVELPSQNRAAVLASDLERLRQAIITYDNWVYAAADNADYKVQSLRAYRPPGFK